MKNINLSKLKSIAKNGLRLSPSRKYTNWPFLKEEHVMIAETARNFANTELAPYAGLLNAIKTKQYSYSKYNNTILN